MEQVHLNRKDGIAKVLGTVSSVAGSLVITLYKGQIGRASCRERV